MAYVCYECVTLWQGRWSDCGRGKERPASEGGPYKSKTGGAKTPEGFRRYKEERGSRSRFLASLGPAKASGTQSARMTSGGDGGRRGQRRRAQPAAAGAIKGRTAGRDASATRGDLKVRIGERNHFWRAMQASPIADT